MLRFRSLPVRLIRAFLMGMPLLLGICSESQQVAIDLMRYKETRRKSTEMIRVWLTPRAGTTDLPQLYEAELLLKTQLPWPKDLLYNWKWTLYVWTSLHVYFVLLILLACCIQFRVSSWRVESNLEAKKEVKEKNCRTGAEVSAKFSEALRRWRERRKRKPPRERRRPELIEGSASWAAGGEEASEVVDDSGVFAASESSEASPAERTLDFNNG